MNREDGDIIATASLLWSIIGVFAISRIAGLLGVAFGINALRRTNSPRVGIKAAFGLCIGAIELIISIIIPSVLSIK